MTIGHPIETRRATTLIVTASLALLYLATLTSDYYWDGITFALQIEKVARAERDVSLLFHQNHLLYNVIGYAAYDISRALSLPTRALHLLQLLNVFAGAAAIGVFFRLAVRVSHSLYAAVISSAALAFAAVWWKVATDANAYVLSIFLVLICAGMLLSDRPRWFLAGTALAVAMLIHQLASLFYPAALAAVVTNPVIDKRWRFASKFSALAWSLTIAAYYLCARLLHDIRDPLAVMKWAVSNPSGVSPSMNPLPGLILFARGNFDMVVGHNFALYRAQGSWVEQSFALAALVSAILCLLMLARRVKSVASLGNSFTPSATPRKTLNGYAVMLITWVGLYMVFLLFWEPWQVLYRAFYLPPLALALSLVLSKYQNAARRPSAAAALAVTTLALFNLAFYIAPQMRATANPRVAAARNAQQIWNDKTVIYFADRNEVDTAFEYFNNQTEWRRFTMAARSGLDAEIRRASNQGGQVWLNKGAIESVDSEWLAGHAYGRDISLDPSIAPAHYIELLPE